MAWGTALLVVALCAGAIVQWVRPLPGATLDVQAVPLPGAAPAFAWPSTGEAAATVVGVGTVGQVRGTQPVPVAGLAEVLAAYVALSDHHLAPGDDGPAIPVTADALTSYQSGLASQESEIPVAAGETLTELQVLEGLLIGSGADMATVLADWDAGSVTAFVTKMNAAATTLGLTSTHITDPTGVDPATTSTAEDLVRLGEASLTNTVLRQIVSLAQTSLPMTNVLFNLNFDLGQDGIIGIKTGSDAERAGLLSLRGPAERRRQGRHGRRRRPRANRAERSGPTPLPSMPVTRWSRASSAPCTVSRCSRRGSTWPT